MPDGFILTVIKALLLVNLLMGFFGLMTVIERKLIGRMQTRYGPNRIGPYGMLQFIPDLGKLLQKQNVVPYGAHRRLYLAAPFISLFAAISAFAVIPFGGVATVPGTDWQINLWIGDSNVGVLYVAAIGSMGFYGMLLGGWAAGSKYALLGGLRAVAQLVSYEVAFTLSVIGVIMQAGTLSLNGIVEAQSDYWYIGPQIVGFVIFYIAALAECNRPPFDLAEADGEIVAGFHTEYGGLRYAMFANAEFVEAITLSALGSVLFLGGWQGPVLPGPVWMLIKMLVLLFTFIWVRATVPRLRYDRLMQLGWKVLLPIATLNLLGTAAWVALS
jgi:NADH-quinone oxidoreductase subunit H